MQDFFLIRHGETDWNVKFGRLQGHTDIPLNEKGQRQAQALTGLASNLGITKIISSDLIRAKETADLLSLTHGKIETSAELREVHLGVGEGLTWEEVKTKLGEKFRHDWNGHEEIHIDLKFPGGESRGEVLTRVTNCLTRYLVQHPNDKIAFVTHGFVIRVLVQHLSIHKNPFFVPNCAVVPFARNHDNSLMYKGPPTIEELLQPKLAD